MLSCELPDDWIERQVQYVTVGTRPCDLNLNGTLQIQQELWMDQIFRNFTVCTSPVTPNFSDVTGFIEYMEVNQMFGADYFIVYNTSISSNLLPVIESYIEEGSLEVIQWNTQILGNDSGYTNAKVAMINDCIYRARITSR